MMGCGTLWWERGPNRLSRDPLFVTALLSDLLYFLSNEEPRYLAAFEVGRPNPKAYPINKLDDYERFYRGGDRSPHHSRCECFHCKRRAPSAYHCNLDGTVSEFATPPPYNIRHDMCLCLCDRNFHTCTCNSRLSCTSFMRNVRRTSLAVLADDRTPPSVAPLTHRRCSLPTLVCGLNLHLDDATSSGYRGVEWCDTSSDDAHNPYLLTELSLDWINAFAPDWRTHIDTTPRRSSGNHKDVVGSILVAIRFVKYAGHIIVRALVRTRMRLSASAVTTAPTTEHGVAAAPPPAPAPSSSHVPDLVTHFDALASTHGVTASAPTPPPTAPALADLRAITDEHGATLLDLGTDLRILSGEFSQLRRDTEHFSSDLHLLSDEFRQFSSAQRISDQSHQDAAARLTLQMESHARAQEDRHDASRDELRSTLKVLDTAVGTRLDEMKALITSAMTSTPDRHAPIVDEPPALDPSTGQPPTTAGAGADRFNLPPFGRGRPLHASRAPPAASATRKRQVPRITNHPPHASTPPRTTALLMTAPRAALAMPSTSTPSATARPMPMISATLDTVDLSKSNESRATNSTPYSWSLTLMRQPLPSSPSNSASGRFRVSKQRPSQSRRRFGACSESTAATHLPPSQTMTCTSKTSLLVSNMAKIRMTA